MRRSVAPESRWTPILMAKEATLEWNDSDLMLVTGATGLVGSHVVERARQEGIRVRALVRPTSDAPWLNAPGIEKVAGDLSDRASLNAAVAGATLIVHCAAKVGDWGPVEGYREVNVRGLETLLNEAEAGGALRRFVHVSSLGVYPAQDHYGTDETAPTGARGIDGYTLTKLEAEQLVLRHVREKGLPAVVLRPGFIYGPRDRTVIPRLVDRIRAGVFRYLGTGEKLMNNTFVGNLVDAIFLALRNDAAVGQVFNITDGRTVTKKEFVGTIAQQAGLSAPTRHVPLPVARALAAAMESTWRLLGKKEAPLLSSARIKFLGLNLDYSIEKARRELQYTPHVDFTDGMRRTMDWFRSEKLL